MMIHPVHAVALATNRHRELVARADEFRAAGRVPAGPRDRRAAAD